MLELEQVTKTYRLGAFGRKSLRAVDGATFGVARGEVVALIGESGSGKTTIGKLVLRLLSATGGRILFADKDIAIYHGRALKDYYRRVQGVFQDPFSSFNPVFKADRVFSVVRREYFPGVAGGEWQSKLFDVLKRVGLNPSEVLGKYVHQLSGGQLQRLLVARALLLDIELLVADEVISMLDASTRVDVLNALASLKEDRRLSILFITHDLSLAYYISDQAVILYRGAIVERGRIEKVYGNPLHPYTQVLMASVPRLDAKWESSSVELKCELVEPTVGCVFFSRCLFPRRDAECRTRRPGLQEVEPGHFVACWRQGSRTSGVAHPSGEKQQGRGSSFGSG